MRCRNIGTYQCRIRAESVNEEGVVVKANLGRSTPLRLHSEMTICIGQKCKYVRNDKSTQPENNNKLERIFACNQDQPTPEPNLKRKRALCARFRQTPGCVHVSVAAVMRQGKSIVLMIVLMTLFQTINIYLIPPPSIRP